MDVLRQLTRKFRAQDINDTLTSTSYSSTSPLSSASFFQMKDEEVLDSGTASDEEEEEEVEEEGEEKEVEEEREEESTGHLSEDPIMSVELESIQPLLAWTTVPTSVSSSPHTNSFLSTSSSPFSSFSHQVHAFPMATGDTPSYRDGRHSVVTCSDYERCSLDFEASSSASELGFNSSEEELASINRDEKWKRSQFNDEPKSMKSDGRRKRSGSTNRDENRNRPGSMNRDDKRKRSQLSDDSSVFSDDDDDDYDDDEDDDEVHELFRGKSELLFRSLSVRLTPGVQSSGEPEGVGPAAAGLGGGRGSSPRKRHRRDCWGMATSSAPAGAHHHRPSLDFYKMQKTCMMRKYRTLNRPRLVKLWIVNGSQRPSKSTFDPSPFCFRSLSWTPRNAGNDSPHQMR